MSEISNKIFLDIYESLRVNEDRESFCRLIEALYQYYEQIWIECGTEPDEDFFKRYTIEQKLLNKTQLDTFLGNLVSAFKMLDKDINSGDARKNIREVAASYMNNSEFFNAQISRSYPMDFIRSTKLFISYTEKFDSNFSVSDIFQALRNVWTMNLLQSANNIDVKLTYPILGYSMLYPYTDNMLDSQYITLEEKYFFSERLTRRLKGENIFPLCDYEDKIFKLVSFIEMTYPRKYHYSLYKSLLFIHFSQLQSLKQFDKTEDIETGRIFPISFKKGGISVLTDNFLIKGDLDLDDIIFSFGLGVVLQLIDDLQDVKSDMRQKNRTIFTSITSKSEMNQTTGRLINFVLKVIDTLPNHNSEFMSHLIKAIKQNCILMILFSISRNSFSYSKYFVRNIELYYPFPPSYMKNLNTEINSKCSKIKRLKNITATEMLDILLEKE